MSDEVQLRVQQNPLSLVFEMDNGRTTTARLDGRMGLWMAVNLLDSPAVVHEIRLPRFLQRAMHWALVRSC